MGVSEDFHPFSTGCVSRCQHTCDTAPARDPRFCFSEVNSLTPNSKFITASSLQTPRPQAPDPMRPRQTLGPKFLTRRVPHTLTSHRHSGFHLFLPITPHAHLPPSEHAASPATCPHHTLATTGACGNCLHPGSRACKYPKLREDSRRSCHPASPGNIPSSTCYLPSHPSSTHPAPTAPEAGVHPAGLQAMKANSLGETPSRRYSRCLISVDPSVQSGCLFSH